jgi:hypothetical protein
MLPAPITEDANDVTLRVARVIGRVLKGFNAVGEELAKQESALLKAVMADHEMQALLQDPSALDAMVRAFIEDIVVAKLIETFELPFR